MNFEEPLSNTEDQVVTHDFTDIKNTKDRTKTVSEMLKENPSLTLDSSSKHGTIPPSNTSLKNETKTPLSNNKTNLTPPSSNEKNSTSKSSNQTKASDKLMAYIKGMSKFEDDTDDDFEIINNNNNEPNKKDVKSGPPSNLAANHSNPTAPIEPSSVHNQTSARTDHSNTTATGVSNQHESQETTKIDFQKTTSDTGETMEESRQGEQDEVVSSPRHQGFVSLLKASQKQHQNEVVSIATEHKQRNKTAETEEELRQKVTNEQNKPPHQMQQSTHHISQETLLNEEDPIHHDIGDHTVQHEVRTTNSTTSKSNKTNSSKVNYQQNTKHEKKNTTETTTDLGMNSKETSSDVLTFQMQNTTYKVFDSYPSSKSQTKSRPEPSKVEKASYDTATGVKSKPAPVKQTRPIGLKTPTKAEKQAYNASLNKHQTSKRKLLMNISLADAMEKMNPTPKSSERKDILRSNTTANLPSSNGEGRDVLQQHLNADPGSILGCSKPLRLLYVIDVSEGMGRGTQRLRRWSRLKDFIQNINVNLLKGVEHEYMVYNIEPRIMDGLDKCDRTTELFTIADECLCNKKYHITSDGNGCSVNQPALRENMDDWGKVGPRAGKALQRAKEIYFSKDKEKYKNVILLLSHKQSADDIERIERDLKASGISLIDIELGQRHDLRRKNYIPHAPGYEKQGRSKRSVVVPTHSSQAITVVNNYGKTLLRKHFVVNNKKRTVITPRKRSFIPVNKVEFRKRNKPELMIKRTSVKRKTHKKEDKELLHKPTNNMEIVRRRNNIVNKQQTATKKSIDNSTDDTHKVKVSLKKLTQTLKDIIGKVCTSNTEEELNMRKRSAAILSENFY